MTEEQARELLEVAEHPTLQRAQDMVCSGRSSFKTRAFLESKFTPQVCLAILDCLNCRHRYRDKFTDPYRWLLTRQAAEQATDSRIALWRAQTLAALSPSGSLIELGCGIGGDSVFLSRYFDLTAYERSPARALLAERNLEVLGRSEKCRVEFEERGCETLEGELLYVDPARREDSRLASPDRWQPPLSEVARAFKEERFSVVAVKCAPGLNGHDLAQLDCPYDLFFLGIESQLKEAFLILSQEAAYKREAVIFGPEEAEPMVMSTTHELLQVASPEVGGYLHNPNPAILRSRALDTLARDLDACAVHPKIGYLVGPRPATEPVAQSFHVLDHFPLNWSRVKKALAGMGWSEYEYLGRGVPFSQSDVRNKLPKLKGKKPPRRGSVIIYREEEGYRVVLGERCPKGKTERRESSSP